MKNLKINLDSNLDKALARMARRAGRTKSEIAREALRRQLAIWRLRELRSTILPFAQAQGFRADEDEQAG